MFLTNCLECGLRELRGARSIDTLVTTEQGLDLVYRCTRCATVNLLAPHGSDASAQSRSAAAVAA